jgi:trigger factor
MAFKVDVETVDPLRRRLAVEVPAEDVSAEIEKLYAQLGRSAKVPGFRPGRVPRPVLERLFGDRVRAEVFAKLIQHSYSEVIEDRRIEAVGQPEIVTEQAQPGAALRYSATVEVKPDVTVEHYKGLVVERPLRVVTAADVDSFMERLRQSFAQLHPITTRADVHAGDVVTLDYEARVEGRLISRGEGREVEIGANGFPHGFDQQLIGQAVGADLNFALTYGLDEPTSGLAGKTVQFHVHLRALSQKELPELDDEFAKDHGECATLDELRQRVRGRLEAEAAREADEAVRRALVAQLADANTIPVPNALVQRRLEALVEDVVGDWQKQGIRPRNETEALARLRQEIEPRAREQVKVALLLEALARQERISVSDEEVDGRVAALATAAGSGAERVRALYQNEDARRQLHAQLVHVRAIDAVVARANIRTVEKTSVADAAENG